MVFFARGAHLDAMRRDGLKIESPAGDLHLKPVNVTDDPSTVAPVDIVIFAVKLWDTEKAGAQIKPIVTRTRASSPCRTASTAWSGWRQSSAQKASSAARP